MELKLQLILFMFLIDASLAVWQRVTVMEGKTLTLRCPITNAHQSHVEWKNPKGYVMFFNHNKALKDRRYSIDKLSKTEFTVSVSDITFKDGGNYTCLHYNHTVTEKTVEVTVLGYPKIAVARHGGRKVIKCTAAANHYAPKIFWQIGHVIETAAQPHIITEDNISKYVSVDKLHVQSVRDKVRVKCLVRHPALHSEPLMDFVDIGRPGTKSPRTTSTSSPTTQPQRSTTTHWFERESTTETPATTDLNGPTMFPQMTSSPMTQPDHPGTTNSSESSVSSDSDRSRDDTISNVTSTAGWTRVSEITEENIFYNSTEGNSTREGFDERQKRAGNEGNSSLLVFLVTCLIFALLVVVLFFAIKLRRAHILWKRVFIVTENEDSAPSEESSKSKSSQEERLSQAQRRKGLFNIGFTKYVIEEPTEIITETNTTMTTAERKNKEPTSALHVAPKTEASASNHIKETEL
ncbi:cytotoxic and regulatory T-cell molecule isoform X2 [Myripristis murdjan]|uniref:cytotoxic and regulatory T-cell molecule isoform X2 n=1 Tax=Myripristis murdjan TaxID=586833 RepID=UPI0011761BB5|nr:cytotoxic and regulatory T-cell molecule isoform X2 [Myripristis murdjan]